MIVLSDRVHQHNHKCTILCQANCFPGLERTNTVSHEQRNSPIRRIENTLRQVGHASYQIIVLYHTCVLNVRANAKAENDVLIERARKERTKQKKPLSASDYYFTKVLSNCFCARCNLSTTPGPTTATVQMFAGEGPGTISRLERRVSGGDEAVGRSHSSPSAGQANHPQERSNEPSEVQDTVVDSLPRGSATIPAVEETGYGEATQTVTAAPATWSAIAVHYADDRPGNADLYCFNYYGEEDDNWRWDSITKSAAREAFDKGETVQNDLSAFSPITDGALCKIRREMTRAPHDEELSVIQNSIINFETFQRLKPLVHLNDEIMNCYLSLVAERSKHRRSSDRPLPFVRSFSSFLYKRMLTDGEYVFHNVRRWTRLFDIFNYDLALIPINYTDLHWVLVVINLKAKRIEYYDSLGWCGRVVLSNLRMWVESLHGQRGVAFEGAEWHCVDMASEVGIPQQENGRDCGVFACKYADFISREAKINFSQQHIQYFRARMAMELLVRRVT